MIPCIGAKVAGETYYPLYNNNAMFRMQERCTDEEFRSIGENSRPAFELAFELFRILCEEGEAVREHYGYDKSPLPEWEDAKIEYLPADIMAMKGAVWAAVSLGCDRQVDLDEMVDLTLLELQKKRTDDPAGGLRECRDESRTVSYGDPAGLDTR